MINEDIQLVKVVELKFHFYLLQVIVVAFKNRNLPLPESNEQLYEAYKDATVEKIAHTNQMR